MSFFKSDSECGDYVTRASVTQAQEIRSDFSYGAKVGKREWTPEECAADKAAKRAKRDKKIIDACDLAHCRGISIVDFTGALLEIKNNIGECFDVDILSQNIEYSIKSLKKAYEVIAPLEVYQQAVDDILGNI